MNVDWTGKKKPEKYWAGLIWLNIIWQKKR